MNDVNLICLQREALEILVRTTIENLSENERQSPWLSKKEAMDLLKRDSDSFLNRLREEKQILSHQDYGGRLILYNRQSILDYLQRTAK